MQGDGIGGSVLLSLGGGSVGKSPGIIRHFDLLDQIVIGLHVGLGRADKAA